MAAGSPRARRSRAALLQELRELRDDLVQVADDAEIGELEDRGVAVLVDRDDRPRALHADLVLDRAGDSDGDVELRRHALPRLADLCRVRVPAGVDDGTRRRNRTAKRLRELFDQLEVLGAAETPAARHDHLRLLDRRPLALRVRLLDHRGGRGEVLQLDGRILDLRLAAGLLGIERTGPEE